VAMSLIVCGVWYLRCGQAFDCVCGVWCLRCGVWFDFLFCWGRGVAVGLIVCFVGVEV